MNRSCDAARRGAHVPARVFAAVATLVASTVPLFALFAASALIVVAIGRLSASTTSTSGATAQAQSLEVAQAFTAALNAHDVDGLVDLFTDEDGGPTLTADRYAWLKSEIRLWAQLQADANILVEAYEYRVTDEGITWNADVYRDDWIAVGVTALAVTNSIWVHNGKIAQFTQTARNSDDTERLGMLWQPGSAPPHAMDEPSVIWSR